MNKVTSYFKNMTKSVAYATVDVVKKDLIPEVDNFTDTNKDLFKSVYATVAHSRQSINRAKKYINQTKVYAEVNKGINNAFEDIKTGNFYNKERSDKAYDDIAASWMGGDFDEFDFDFDDDDGSLDSFQDKEVTKGDIVIADSITKSNNLSSQLISTTVANTSRNIIKSNITSTTMLMNQNAQLIAGVRTSIAGVHESINSITKFAVDIFPKHFNTQSQYFTDSMNELKKTNAILNEMVEMQRNVYKQQEKTYKSKDQFGNVFSGGTLDFKEYSKAIWKNIKGFDNTGILDMFSGSEDMLGALFANPLGFAVTGIVRSYIPQKTAKQIASFSKTLGNIFPAMIAKLNKWKKDSSNIGLNFLGRIFGLSIDDKKTVDTSKYNKGAVPFDGITRKAIIEVIPEHLARIESILSGASQRVYDYEEGKWLSAKDLKKKSKERHESIVKSSFYEYSDYDRNFIKSLEKQKALSAKDKRALMEDMQEIKNLAFEQEKALTGDFVRKFAKENGNKKSLDKLLLALAEVYDNIPTSAKSSSIADIYSGKTREARWYGAEENKGHSVYNKLHDNSGFGELITDSSGMNTLNYLQELLINVAYIRENGSGYGGKRKSTSFNNFSKSYRKNFFKTDSGNKASDIDDNYDKNHYDPSVDKDKAIETALKETNEKSLYGDLDSDKFKAFGSRYKEKNKWMKAMDEIPGKTFSEKWKNTSTMGQKFALMMGSASTIARKPMQMFGDMVESANVSIHHFLFEEETNTLDSEGKKIKGKLTELFHKMQDGWTSMYQEFEEKFLNPLIEKYKLREKWEDFKQTKFGTKMTNAASSVKSSLKKNFGGIGDYFKSKTSEAVKDGKSGFANFMQRQKDIDFVESWMRGKSRAEIEAFRLAELNDDQNKILDELLEKNPPGFAAGGKFRVKKTGLISVSKGEEYTVRRRTVTGVRNDAKAEYDNAQDYKENVRTGKSTANNFADVEGINDSTYFGYIRKELDPVIQKIKHYLYSMIGIKGDTPEQQDAKMDEAKKNIADRAKKIFNEMTGKGSDVAAKSIIGGGIGLASGVIGGPIIGAGIGAAVSLLKNSEEVRNILLGPEIKDEKGNVSRGKGLIPKKIQDTFNKYVPDMAKYGATGMVASLIMPFGPLVGAALGAGIGLVKNSNTMSEMLFGDDEGLINADRKKAIAKYLPKAGVGAIAGIAGGMLLGGPFGILGNAAIGTGLGLLSGTEDFKEIIFGEDDGYGNRFGGIKGALQEHFVQPLMDFGNNFKQDFFGFMQESIVNPLKDAIMPITTEVAYWSKKLVFGLPKWLLSLGKDYIAVPILTKLNDTVLDPIAKGIKTVFGSMMSRIKGVISAPFRLAGAVGNSLRKKQIRQGRDAGTAKSRLEFARKKGMGDYGYKEFDEQLAANADNQEYLEDLTARTGMLAHGADYFDKEIKKARKELSRVVSDYYKLGWFSKDKESYKRIRQYIHDNDVEAAIEELSYIQESRAGGPLNTKEATDAYNRFTSANKRYQVARDAKQKFGDINSTDNEAWMEQQFGPNWKKMDAKKLFDYSRKELARKSGNAAVTKSQLFKDPTTIVSAGEREINVTLNKILNVLTHNKDGFFVNEEDEQSFIKDQSAGAKKLFDNINEGKKKIKNKFGTYNSSVIDSLYSHPEVYEFILSVEKQGVKYDSNTVQKLCDLNLSDNELKLLEKYPYIALMDGKDIKKNLSPYRTDKSSLFTNFLFGSRKIRNKELKSMNGLLGQHQSATADDLNNDSLQNKESYKSTEYGMIKYVRDENGGWSIDASDADTKITLAKQKEAEDTKKTFMSSVTGIKDSILKFFGYDKTEKSDKKKEPWFKQFFNFDIGGGSKLKMAASIAALVTGVGALKNLWDNRKEGGVLDTIGSKVSEYVSPVINKVGNWFTNEGEYANGQGSAAFLEKYVYPNFGKGMNVIFGKVLPALVTSFIKNIPNLIKGALKGVGSLFGWNVGNDSKAYADTIDPNIANDVFVADGYTGDSAWTNGVAADAQVTADSLTGIKTDDNGNISSSNNSLGKELAKRVGYNATRSLLTGKKAGMLSKGAKAAFGSADNVLRATIGKVPLLGTTYKIGSSMIKGLGKVWEGTSLGVAKNINLKGINDEQNTKLLGKFVKWLDNCLDALLKLNPLKRKVKEAVAAAGKEATEEAVEKANKTIIKDFLNKVTEYLTKKSDVLAKLVSNMGKKAFTVLFTVTDLLYGLDNAETILGVKNPNIFQTIVAGLANVANNWFFFGLIDTSTVVGWFVDTILPLFGIKSEDIKRQKDELAKEVAEYNRANPDEQLTEEEYLKANTGSITRTVGGAIKNFFKGNTTRANKAVQNRSNYTRGNSNTLNTNSYGARRGGRGTFVSQIDPKYKSQKFNIPGDTEYQTLGDSGCAPATAANVLNYYTGQGSIMKDASKAALNFKDKNGGVTPDYFSNYLGKHGVGTYSTTNKQEILAGIGSGQPTILLGTDPTNRANTPYGASSSHYVLATGLDGKGNVIIQDPESRRPNALYPVKDLISQSHMGVITSTSGRGSRDTRRSRSITSRLRPKLGKFGFGKGSEQIEAQVWSSLRQAGYSEVQVAGIMGNIKHESGFDPAIVERGSGAGFGLCQWTGGRRTQLEKYAKSIGADAANVTVQVAFLIAEMTPGGGANGYAKYQFMSSSSKYDGKSYPAAAFAAATDIETATRAFCFCFERPSYTVHHIDRRVNAAKDYYKKYTGTTPSGSVVGTSTSSSSSSNDLIGGIISAFSQGILGYYDQELLSIFFNDTVADMDTSTTSAPTYIDATGNALSVIETAEREIGTVATNTKGQKYGKEYGYNEVDWCVIFAWWVFKHAGCSSLFYGGNKTAGCQSLLDYYRKNNQLVNTSQGRPGDLIFFNWEGGTSPQHVGLVEANNGGVYTTIEGNTGSQKYAGGAVMRKTRQNSSAVKIVAIVRPNYAVSGMGNTLKLKNTNFLQPGIKATGNIAAAVLSGKGSKGNKISKYLNTISSGGRGTSGTVNKANTYLTTSYSNNTPRIASSLGARTISGRSSVGLPSLSTNYSGRATTISNTGYSNTATTGMTATNSTDKLLAVIIDILQIIANNSEKLSEIVSLLSRALNLELTDNDISGLSSNNAKIKNKIANALRSQGSANGLGSSIMDASTESLASAMYHIARA